MMIDLIYPNDYDQSTIMYNGFNGTVYGGSQPQQKISHILKNLNGYFPACTYKFELDISNKTFAMELDGEKIIIDSKIGDFQYSPFVAFGCDSTCTCKDPVEIKLL